MDGCFGGDDASFEYMNTPSVQERFHVRESALARPAEWRWSVCADEPYVNYTKTVLDLSKEVIPGLVKSGVRVLVFSGDVDACVPYTLARIHLLACLPRAACWSNHWQLSMETP